jgi:hypothetical protein
MRHHPAARAYPATARIHPALRSFADECWDTGVRVLAYVGALILIGLVVFYAANPLTDAAIDAAATPAVRPEWSVAPRSHPAFSLGQLDWPGKSASYEVLRHPAGGRKDILRVGAPGEPTAEIEVYRIGAEPRGLPPEAELAARIEPQGTAAVQNAGVIETKFGAVVLLGLAGASGPAAGCLGFVQPLEAASLRLSGYVCHGDSGVQRRAAVGCLLDRLVLLSGDAATAAAFAQAELRRGGRCGANQLPGTAAADWVTGPHDPRLRGAL